MPAGGRRGECDVHRPCSSGTRPQRTAAGQPRGGRRPHSPGPPPWPACAESRGARRGTRRGTGGAATRGARGWRSHPGPPGGQQLRRRDQAMLPRSDRPNPSFCALELGSEAKGAEMVSRAEYAALPGRTHLQGARNSSTPAVRTPTLTSRRSPLLSAAQRTRDDRLVDAGAVRRLGDPHVLQRPRRVVTSGVAFATSQNVPTTDAAPRSSIESPTAMTSSGTNPRACMCARPHAPSTPRGAPGDTPARPRPPRA